jgi:hypothetical protein
VHYNGEHPAIAKTSGCLPKRDGVFAFSNHFRRATKRLIACIIDCAFENSEKSFCRNLRFRQPLILRIGIRAATLKPNTWKDFSPETFPPRFFWNVWRFSR